MKEQDFFDERVAFEGELVDVIDPLGMWRVRECAGEWQVPFLQREWGRAWCPELCFGKERVPRFQPPDMSWGRGNKIAHRP